jgi:hypothetical protein
MEEEEKLDHVLPVRISSAMWKRIAACAARSGMTGRTAVIKMCLYTFLDFFEKNGAASLPPNWREILAEQDGRVRRFRYPSPKARKFVVAEHRPKKKKDGLA